MTSTPSSTASPTPGLQSIVAQTVALEGHLLASFAALGSAAAGNTDAASVLALCRDLAETHRATLLPHLERLGTAAPNGARTVMTPATAESPSAALIAAHALLGGATAHYVALRHAALVLFDLPLRAVPLPHLRDYVRAAAAVSQQIAPALTAELRASGLACACTCPICTLGACVCVVSATDDGENVRRDTLASSSSPPTFALGPLRAGSPLTSSSARPGDILVAVAGKDLTYFRDVNTLLKEITPGSPISLTVRRDEQRLEVVLPSR